MKREVSMVCLSFVTLAGLGLVCADGPGCLAKNPEDPAACMTAADNELQFEQVLLLQLQSGAQVRESSNMTGQLLRPQMNVSAEFLAQQKQGDNSSFYGHLIDLWASLMMARTQGYGPVKEVVDDYRFLPGYWAMWPSLFLWFSGMISFFWILGEVILHHIEPPPPKSAEEKSAEAGGTPTSTLANSESFGSFGNLQVLMSPPIVPVEASSEVQNAAFKRGQRTWYDLITELVKEQPHDVALVVPGATAEQEQLTLTFGQFEVVIEYYASMLEKRVRAADNPSSRFGPVVGLYMERCAEYVCILIANSKLGSRSMPLPPAYPQQRLVSIVDLSKAAAVCVIKTDAPSTMGWCNCLVECPPFKEALKLAKQPGLPPAQRKDSPERGGIILCSSGSTGNPKLIARAEKSFAHRLSWTWANIPYGPGETAVQKSFMATTHSLYELMEALLTGHTVYVLPDVGTSGVVPFWAHVRAAGARRLLLVPSLLAASLSAGGSVIPSALSIVLLMGEPPQVDACRRLLQRLPSVRIYSLYGSTEASSSLTLDITTLVDQWDEEDAMTGKPNPSRAFPMGHPVHGSVKMHLLDEEGKVVTNVGGIGVLHFEGPHLLDEYIGMADLTANVLKEHEGLGLLYNTNDRVEMMADGTLRYVGRADDLVKIRGNRVQLGEVEHHLLEHPEVDQACALVEQASGNLIAFISPVVTSAEDVKEFVAARVPPYMVPKLLPLEALPKLPNGKVDKVSLKSWLLGHSTVMKAQAMAGGRAVGEPTDPDQAGVMKAIEDITGVRPAGTQKLADLGLDSISIMRLSLALRKMKLRVPDVVLLQNPTVDKVVEVAKQAHGGSEHVVLNLDTISGLRFMMSFLVMRYHWSCFVSSNILTQPDTMQQWRPKMFMILAGSMLSIKYSNETTSTWNMLLANVPQVFPVYWIALLIDAPIETMGNWDWSFMSLWTIILNVFILQNLWPENDAYPGFMLKLYGVGPAYYLLAQIMFTACYNHLRDFLLWQMELGAKQPLLRYFMLATAAGFIHVASFVWPIDTLFAVYGTHDQMPLHHIPLFFLGAVAGHAILNIKLPEFEETCLAWFTDIMIVLIVFQYENEVGIMVGQSLAMTDVSFVALMVFLICRTPCYTAKFLASPYVAHGELSFVTYILHWPIIRFCLFCFEYQLNSFHEVFTFKGWFTPYPGSSPTHPLLIDYSELPPWTYLGVFAFVFLISMIVTWSIHQPMQKVINRWLLGTENA